MALTLAMVDRKSPWALEQGPAKEKPSQAMLVVLFEVFLHPSCRPHHLAQGNPPIASRYRCRTAHAPSDPCTAAGCSARTRSGSALAGLPRSAQAYPR